jgi:multidrug efflux system membrane fusion protein
LTVGCPAGGPDDKGKDAPPPPVYFVKPVQREVRNFLYYTGRTEAVETVDVKCRVSGYLMYVIMRPDTVVRGPEPYWQLGTSTVGVLSSVVAPAPLVAAAALSPARARGEVLFAIDPRPYEVELQRSIAHVEASRADVKFTAEDYKAYKDAYDKDPGVTSLQNVRKAEAAQLKAAANLEIAIAALQSAKLNMEFTEVTAPITGRVGLNRLTTGNLVMKDDSVLTTIVSEDWMFVYFDMEAVTLQKIRKLTQEGKLKSLVRDRLPVFMGLEIDKDKTNPFPHEGHIDFITPKTDATTGTATIRAVFFNPKPRQLRPGEFARIQLPLGDPHKALLVPEKAKVPEQNLMYLLVLDDQDRVPRKLVTLGQLQDDGQVVIENGLSANDRVLVSGLELKSGKKVHPQLWKETK